MVRHEEGGVYSEVDREEAMEKNRSELFNQHQTKRCLLKCCKIFAIILAVAILLLLILIFVVTPLVFMLSIEVQRFAMFPNIDQPSNPQYDNFELYGVEGGRNIYASVNDMLTNKTISLGIWHLLPEAYVIAGAGANYYDFDRLLGSGEFPVVIYFHGNSGTRIAPLDTLLVLRKYFHVLAFDYRNYGDSTPALLTELAVVDDSVQLYRWVQTKTIGDIYVWGHSLGTALSTRTVKVLGRESVVPLGLVLEAPFTTMREELPVHPLGKIFAWLPYFTATFLDPLDKNDFHFRTTTNVLEVNCPILIMNAEDDSIIPHRLGRQLAEVAATKRDVITQGNVMYYLFEGHLGYNHLGLTEDPRVPGYIEKFVTECENFRERNVRSKRDI